MERDTLLLREHIHNSRQVVVFTGAGISTESGIPDFRGPEGIWKKIQPIDFSDFMASEEVRRDAWQRKFSGEDKLTNAAPNSGHLAVAKLVEYGKISHVITQNVDNLHQVSGIPDEQVIELHGNAHYATCLSCGVRYELPALRRDFLATGNPPYCTDCGGIIKTATISFGQAMPVAEMQRAEAATLACDLMIAIGSSLTVYPAAGFPVMAKRNGAALVILNNEATELDAIADLVVNQQIGPTLSAVID